MGFLGRTHTFTFFSNSLLFISQNSHLSLFHDSLFPTSSDDSSSSFPFSCSLLVSPTSPGGGPLLLSSLGAAENAPSLDKDGSIFLASWLLSLRWKSSFFLSSFPSRQHQFLISCYKLFLIVSCCYFFLISPPVLSFPMVSSSLFVLFYPLSAVSCPLSSVSLALPFTKA